MSYPTDKFKIKKPEFGKLKEMKSQHGPKYQGAGAKVAPTSKEKEDARIEKAEAKAAEPTPIEAWMIWNVNSAPPVTANEADGVDMLARAYDNSDPLTADFRLVKVTEVLDGPGLAKKRDKKHASK